MLQRFELFGSGFGIVWFRLLNCGLIHGLVLSGSNFGIVWFRVLNCGLVQGLELSGLNAEGTVTGFVCTV